MFIENLPESIYFYYTQKKDITKIRLIFEGKAIIQLIFNQNDLIDTLYNTILAVFYHLLL